MAFWFLFIIVSLSHCFDLVATKCISRDTGYRKRSLHCVASFFAKLLGARTIMWWIPNTNRALYSESTDMFFFLKGEVGWSMWWEVGSDKYVHLYRNIDIV